MYEADESLNDLTINYTTIYIGGDSTLAEAGNIFSVTQGCSGNFHMETPLRGRLFNMFFLHLYPKQSVHNTDIVVALHS